MDPATASAPAPAPTASSSPAPTHVSLSIEFTGGLELLFSNRRKHTVSLPSRDECGEPACMGYLVRYLCQHVMKDRRKEMFVLDGALYGAFPFQHSLNHPSLTFYYRRPGILVLINEADWELEGEEMYQLQDDDNVLFVSTLHGG